MRQIRERERERETMKKGRKDSLIQLEEAFYDTI